MRDAKEKTAWEIAENWYSVGEIAYSIARAKRGFGSFAMADPKKPWNAIVPTDVYSQEFAEWLTHQYRLAMAKGIQIGRKGIDALVAERDRLKEELAMLRSNLDMFNDKSGYLG